MSRKHFGRTLVVGGSGMLAGCCHKLLTVSDTVSVMARNEDRIRAISKEIHPLICDYNDGGVAAGNLHGQSFDLVVAWIHGRAPELRRMLAGHVCSGGHFLQVLGSAHADPSRPDRLEEMKAVAADLPIVYQAVVLGFVLDGGQARWLTDLEISNGVFGAVERGAAFTVVGSVEPWPARP